MAARQKLFDRLPMTGNIPRGSVLTRTIRNHAKGCAKCLRPERVAEVRRWIANYQKLKVAIEAICELNHELLRPGDDAPSRRRSRNHD